MSSLVYTGLGRVTYAGLGQKDKIRVPLGPHDILQWEGEAGSRIATRFLHHYCKGQEMHRESPKRFIVLFRQSK